MSENNLAPIAVFVYKRLEHTKCVIEALKENLYADKSEVFIFSDGYKSEDDKAEVLALREYLKTLIGFKNIEIIERQENYGLNNNISSGITEMLDKYENLIIIEDDILTGKYFLKFMNEGLQKFKNNKKVASIQGYFYPITGDLSETFFLQGAFCWGWATWKRAWKFYNGNAQFLIEKLEERNEFNNRSPDFKKCLELQAEGKAQAWDVCWSASVVINDMYSLFPAKSLTTNIGCDNSGTQCTSDDDYYAVEISNKPITYFSDKIEENPEARNLVLKFSEEIEKKKAQYWEEVEKQRVQKEWEKKSGWHKLRKTVKQKIIEMLKK